jgi:hypothetical protein
MISSSAAADFLLLPKHQKTISAETLPYSQMLHTGVEDKTFCMRGRFGVDFPFAGYRFGKDGNPRQVFLGINAAAHINMLPTSGMRFPVDNFYAVLAINLSGDINRELSWRVYPIHHVSAHLADGHPGIKETNIRPVSTEMARGEIYYKPFGDILELGAGAGWHYHVCAQKDLRYRIDASILVTPLIPWIDNNLLRPYFLIRAESVKQGKHNPGIDISTGAFAVNSGDKRLFGISLRYFNRLHTGYYFERYEKGWGAEYTFIY